jgi:hypothetical protein
MKKTRLTFLSLFLTLLVMAAFFVNGAVTKQPPWEKTYELKYKMVEGTRFTMTSASELNSIMDQMGTEVTADIISKGMDVYVVLSADREKGSRIEIEYGEKSQDMESPMGGGSTDFTDLIGKKATFTLLQNGKVEDFEGFDDLPEITAATGEVLKAETYQLGVRFTFPLLPDRPVKIGETWLDNQNVDIPVGESTLQSENSSTYTLIEEMEMNGFDCLKIQVTGISKLSGDFEQGGTPLSLERETKSSGTIYFAYKEGMFISSESESTGDGIIYVPSAGIDLPQTITSKSSVKVSFDK